MLPFIDIKNFRCFQHTRVENLKQVNLITGLNNAGKTSFLEAVYMLLRFDLFLENFKIRLKNEEDKDALLNLYYNQNHTEAIVIETDRFLFQRLYLTENNYKNVWLDKDYCGYDYNYDEYRDYIYDHNHADAETNIKDISLSFILDKYNQYPKLLNLSDMVDEFDISGQKDVVLQAVQLVDASIEDLRTFNKKRDVLYAKQNGVYRPLQYFGDALQKIILYILAIISAKGEFKVLLIDEIENGVHYTIQAQLWEYVFKLAAAYQVQIFATTHSLEMIKAFEKTARAQNFSDKIACVELAKHAKTGQIVSNTIDAAQLKYNLENHLELRGE